MSSVSPSPRCSPRASSSPSPAPDSDCYVLRLSGKAWQVTGELRAQLLATGAWTLAKRDDQPAHLLLADRGRVQWAREMSGRPPSIPARFERMLTRQALPTLCMVNAYRGCNELSNKSALVKTLRQHALDRNYAAAQMEYFPTTFILRAGGVDDERALFLSEFARLQQQLSSAADAGSSSEKNVWIVKANRGAKGASIFVSGDAAELIAYVDARASSDAAASSPSAASTPRSPPAAAAASSGGPLTARAPPLRPRLGSAAHTRTKSLAASASDSWVVQRYVSSPFLLSGRKFDIRCWVLLDSKYRMFLYRQGVCRTSSSAYSTDNLADVFVHLTNHCIQEAHPDFDKQEKGNELFFPQLQAYLDALPVPDASSDSPLPSHPLCVICHLLPQIRHVVSDTLGAVRSRMESTGDFHSWQLFGFDFMLDESFHLRLLEINATPASAQALLADLVAHLRQRAIEPFFPSEPAATPRVTASGSLPAAPMTPRAVAAASASSRSSGSSAFSFAHVLSRPCSCASLLRGTSKAEYLAPQDRSINLFDAVA